jgi:7-keto-8-aminopelargonate synthetase-like enzyme
MAQLRDACKSYCNKLKQMNRYRILPTTMEENNDKNNRHRHFYEDDGIQKFLPRKVLGENWKVFLISVSANGPSSATILDFSNNDYLSLSSHPEVCRASIEFTQKYGCGSTGSRLLSGDSQPIRDLERRIARDKQAKGGALVFNTGYQANISVLATLLDPNLYGEVGIFVLLKIIILLFSIFSGENDIKGLNGLIRG